MPTIVLNTPLTWRDVAAIAGGARLDLSDAARQRIIAARKIVEALVQSGTRAYGINTGVGALSNMVVDRPKQSELSRNIILSHAAGNAQGQLTGAEVLARWLHPKAGMVPPVQFIRLAEDTGLIR